MNDKIVLINEEDIERKEKFGEGSFHYLKREITKRKDFDQAYIAIYDVLPEKTAFPLHYHHNNTEAFYIIEGEGEVRTIDNVFKIKKGDTIVFPPGRVGAHQITNTSKDTVLTYIDFDTVNSPDVVEYPDSKKVGVIIHNKSADFYEKQSRVDYYKGE